VFCWYLLAKKTFIWGGDGWAQHYKALVYYAKYLRSIIRELLYNHRLVFPEWDFAFGEGNDILQTLHYYVIGDPFAVLSVLVPTRFLWVYYSFMVLFRLYLAGIAFSCLCFYTKKGIGRYAVMAGALSYVFCYWAILNVNRHPYFLNPLLYFPLILLGIEKILNEEKKGLLTVSVFLAAISNFYYFYVIVLMTVAYVVVRLLVKYKRNLKSLLKALLQIAGSSILGTLMGSLILLPVLYCFLNDTRMASGNAWHLLYPLSYYSKLLGAFFEGSGDYWLCLGYSAPVILALFLLFLRKKEHKTLKACFLVCLTIILVPACGQLLNGMSYMSNKWCWAFALLCTYIFAVMWQDLMDLDFGDAVKLAAGLCICFFGIFMLGYSRTKAAFACIGIAFMFLLVIFPVRIESPQIEARWKGSRQALALALVIVGIGSVGFFKNAPAANNYVSEATGAGKAMNQLLNTEANAVASTAAADDVTDFYRYSGRSLNPNGNVLVGLSCTQYYWSISNPYISDYRKETEQIETLPHSYSGYDDRTALLSLSSVLYYVIPESDNSPLPYGFSYVDTLSGSKIYRNDYALPLTYTYNSTINEETWAELSAVEKQEAMLQAVLLTGYEGEAQACKLDLSSQSLDYTIECNGTGITLEDYGFVVTAANSSVTINFEGLADSETYFSIKGLDFDGVSTYELYLGDEKYDPLDLFSKTRWKALSLADKASIQKSWLFWTEPTGANLTLQASSGVSKTINYYTEDYTWYNDRHDFTVNLDYSEDAVTSLTLTFSAVGVYSFDSIELICQPMDRYADQIAALKSSCLENVELGTNTVSGTIALDQSEILCFSIPYSIGWTAYVDGKEATLYKANVKNMALALDAGTHTITLTYHTPYLRIGAILSAGSLALFIALWCYERRKRQKRETDVHVEVEQ
jgi:uncharacterized membrane protein YfhO